MHQLADGLKEVELGGSSIGTTKKGIGPTYSSKASRSGVRVHHLVDDFPEFERRVRSIVANKKKRFGNFDYDVDAEIERYKVESPRQGRRRELSEPDVFCFGDQPENGRTDQAYGH